MWAHNPNTKKRRKIAILIDHMGMRINSIALIFKNLDLTYHQPHNKREKNQDDNRQIDNTPAWKKKREE